MRPRAHLFNIAYSYIAYIFKAIVRYRREQVRVSASKHSAWAIENCRPVISFHNGKCYCSGSANYGIKATWCQYENSGNYVTGIEVLNSIYHLCHGDNAISIAIRRSTADLQVFAQLSCTIAQSIETESPSILRRSKSGRVHGESLPSRGIVHLVQ